MEKIIKNGMVYDPLNNIMAKKRTSVLRTEKLLTVSAMMQKS